MEVQFGAGRQVRHHKARRASTAPPPSTTLDPAFVRKLEWAARHHPLMLSVFENVLDRAKSRRDHGAAPPLDWSGAPDWSDV